MRLLVLTHGVLFDPLRVVSLYYLPHSLRRRLLHINYRVSNRIQDGRGVREHVTVLKATHSASISLNLEFFNVRVQLIAKPALCRL